VGDLTKRFRERYVSDDVALDTPLYRAKVFFFVQLRKHRLSGTLSIPTRRGLGVPRAISLRFRAPHFDLAHPIRTVRVVPPHS
jgi:hypothetical protein